MAFEEKRKCIWHAFNALDEHQNDAVQVSQLKVLTHNIANTLGVQRAEQSLDMHQSSTALSFKDFLHIVQSEIFDPLLNSPNEVDYNKVDEVCWMVCSKKYLKREQAVLSDDGVYKLWRVFNFLAECDSEGVPLFPVVMDCDEVAFVFKEYTETVGETWNEKDFETISKEIPLFNYHQVLNYMESHCAKDQQTSVVSAGLQELYNQFINDVIRKGWLTKKGHMMTNWKERWFVLTPSCLKYFTNRDEVELKGEVRISSHVKVEALPDKPSHKMGQHRFHVCSETGKTYEIGAKDMKNKNRWIRAVQLAINHAPSAEKFQRTQAMARKAERDAARAKAKEDEERRRKEMEEMEKTKSELEILRKMRAESDAKLLEEASLRESEQKRLEELKKAQAEVEARLKEETALREADRKQLEELAQARAEAEERLRKETDMREEDRKKLEELVKTQAETEARLLEESALREAEQVRLHQLEDAQKQLEEMLQEEIQAKKDEEIVRSLQARLLEEEFEKREALEKLKAEQEQLLETERQKRVGLEEAQKKQEEMLNEAKVQLERLELERKAADQKMMEAAEKLKEAEKAREAAKAKVRERQKPVGLARLITPEPNPFITHRGYGAFSEAEFLPKSKRQNLLSHDPEKSDTMDGNDSSPCVSPVGPQSPQSPPALPTSPVAASQTSPPPLLSLHENGGSGPVKLAMNNHGEDEDTVEL
ncbi:switch-associated protein 70 isoform X2 [Lingula anatina]|uniref:Switch-associated protein 70 isoform X2 n=1 Tax=Lingula anatina TaxID=7574 RepID=A0A1S3HVT9_LINAN|nr:switch-associated protein 70 isoform X2 [Lingula anatina]|eukprot:XP_013390157.1 switch-associated protein 70 isoform X2 [Lingula anatina]